VRVDSHAYAGLAVPPFYDSLLAKICVHGDSRVQALDRMSAALADTHVGGINTTLDVCRAVMRDPAFRAGGVSIDYLPAFYAGLHWAHA